MALQWDEVDGVPVVWVQGQPPLAAALRFRVGVRDESLATSGITHLIEHLTMSTLGRRRYEHNASVDLTFTDFQVAGRPEIVVNHLADVCAGLRNLPMERVATETKVLKAENSDAVHPIVSAHLLQRFGLRGLGLADLEPPALGDLSPEQIAAFAQRFFTRQNAVLALTGPPPEGLRLDLPDGTRQLPPPNPPLGIPMPMWFEFSDDGFGLSFDASGHEPLAREAARTVLGVAVDRAQDDLRMRHGWLYHVDYDAHSTERGQTVCFTADPPVEHAEDVRKGLTGILRDLHSTGPTESELAEDQSAVRDALDHPDSPIGEVGAAATAALLDQPVTSAEERWRLRQEVTAADCRAVLSRLEESLIVAMPPDTPPQDPALNPEPLCSTTRVSGKPLRRTVSGLIQIRPRRSQLVVADDGLTMETPDGPLTILWDDLVGVAQDHTWEEMTLIGADSVMVPFAARWFRAGDEVLAQINRHIDPQLHFHPDDGHDTRLDRWMSSLDKWAASQTERRGPKRNLSGADSDSSAL
jgi:predicted Zn-dependent peptidase